MIMNSKKNTPDAVYNVFDLIRFAWDKKWILIGLTLLAFILSIIVSLNITPRFQSKVVLFPAAAVSISKNLVETSSFSTDSRDILSFGGDDETERMLQILHSNQIKDHIQKKYDLMTHYDIDTTAAYPQTQLDNKYRGNIKFKRTEFMAIEIKVLDTDAQLAADIANEIAAYVDSTIHNMQRVRALEAFNIVEKEYQSTLQEIELISDSLQKIRQLGVIDYQSQASSLNTAYTNALIQGNTSAANTIQNRMNTLSKYGGIYVELSRKLESEVERLGQLKVKYASQKLNVEQTLPYLFVVDKATKAERKAVPRRTITVIVSTMSAFALALLLLLIINNLKARI
jgi:uncharacterized protein involved in exopolysaccharide biosynthesis